MKITKKHEIPNYILILVLITCIIIAYLIINNKYTISRDGIMPAKDYSNKKENESNRKPNENEKGGNRKQGTNTYNVKIDSSNSDNQKGSDVIINSKNVNINK